jgi:hypothetical protein
MRTGGREADSAESDYKTERRVGPRMVTLELRRRAFNRTIASIDKLLLSNTEDYLERPQSDKLLQSQIERTLFATQSA